MGNFVCENFDPVSFDTDCPPALQPAGGGDSTGYRRKRRFLRRLIKRKPEVRREVEAFLQESAQTLVHAGVLPGPAQDELRAYHDVLSEVLEGRYVNTMGRLAAGRIEPLVRQAVVDSILQALNLQGEWDEEEDEEAIILALLH